MVQSRADVFALKIREKYEDRAPGGYYGASLVYRREKKAGGTVIKQNLNQFFTREFETRLMRYEKKYYQYVTSRDDSRWIQTLEQISVQPGEKKQLIHLFSKLGVVNRYNREWQETEKSLRKYEEEFVRIRRQFKYQEELIRKQRAEELSPVSMRNITREVMEHIRREIHFERLRYGLDG